MKSLTAFRPRSNDPIRLFISLLAMGTLSACTLDPPSRSAQLQVDLSAIPQAEGENVNHSPTVSESAPSLSSASDFTSARNQAAALASITPPASASAFDCMFVNVVGPGIARDPLDDDEETTTDQALAQLRLGKSCTYLGLHSGRFAKGAPFSASLSVPAGSERYVQVIGIRDQRVGAPACGAEFLNETDGASVGYFELSRERIDLFSDQAVTMSNHYDAASAVGKIAREIRCGDACTPFFETQPDMTPTYYTLTNTHDLFIRIDGAMAGRYLRSLQLRAVAGAAVATAFHAEIFTHNGTAPGNPANLTFSPTSVASVSTTLSDINLSMYSSVNRYFFPQSGTTYWIRLIHDGGADISIAGGMGGNSGDLLRCPRGSTSSGCSPQSDGGTNKRAHFSLFSCD